MWDHYMFYVVVKYSLYISSVLLPKIISDRLAMIFFAMTM